MTNSIKTTTYHRFALLLGALGLVAVACSDDDGVTPVGGAGTGGTSGGKGNAGSSSGGKNSAGTNSAGTNNAGTSNAGTSNAGTNSGGEAGSSAGAGMAGESMGGSDALGGQGGESLGGAAGSAQGGAGGAPPEVTPDVLDDANFGAYGAGWSEEGNVDASSFKWIYGEEPGLNHWAATAYKVATLQKLDPLPNGTYSFSVEVQRAANLNDQYLFARGCKAGEPAGEVTQSTAAAGSGTPLSKITLSNIEVTSGSCTVGIYTDAPADGWANIDNAVFSLQ